MKTIPPYALEPIHTVRIRSIDVIAKEYAGDYYAVTFSNRKQAYERAAQLGADWAVYCFGRPFYVGRSAIGGAS